MGDSPDANISGLVVTVNCTRGVELGERVCDVQGKIRPSEIARSGSRGEERMKRKATAHCGGCRRRGTSWSLTLSRRQS